MRKITLSALFLAIFGSIFFLNASLVASKDFLSFKLGGFLNPLSSYFANLFNTSESLIDAERLTLENQRLKAQLLTMSNSPKFLKSEERSELIAKIYSTYPFNNRSLLTINAGSNHGVRNSMPVAVDGVFLLGQVIEAASRTSLVRTIFDPEWQMPVKIESDAVDALLQGGREPRLTLIDRNQKIKAGQAVYAASRDFPYGLKIGEVSEIYSEASRAFQEAALAFPYEFGNLTEVTVITE